MNIGFLKKFFSKVRQKIEEKFDRLAKRNSQNNYTRDRSFFTFQKNGVTIGGKKQFLIMGSGYETK